MERKQPTSCVIAVTCGQIQIDVSHFRKREIEQIAKDEGAEIVYLKPAAEEEKKRH